MTDKTYSILFLSRRGSARGLMAEAVVNRYGKGKFKAFSAAVEPAEAPDPQALEALRRAGYAVEGLRPKHWNEFVEGDHSVHLDFVFTVSDTAAGEPMPAWKGGPVTAHWSYLDPVLVAGEAWEQAQAYGRVLAGLERQLRTFIEFPISTLDRMSLQEQVDALGRTEGKAAGQV